VGRKNEKEHSVTSPTMPTLSTNNALDTRIKTTNQNRVPELSGVR
jgi:hypothetical protein